MGKQVSEEEPQVIQDVLKSYRSDFLIKHKNYFIAFGRARNVFHFFSNISTLEIRNSQN